MQETSADQDRRRLELHLNNVIFSLDKDEFRTEKDPILTIRICCYLVQSLVTKNSLSIFQASEHKYCVFQKNEIENTID